MAYGEYPPESYMLKLEEKQVMVNTGPVSGVNTEEPDNIPRGSANNKQLKCQTL